MVSKIGTRCVTAAFLNTWQKTNRVHSSDINVVLTH